VSKESFQALVEVVGRLRRECPWDREQTSKSIMPYLIEEAYEVLEALEAEDAVEVRNELGDLLLQILLHSEMASERGEFDVYDVAEAVREKMIRRHPHVFDNLAVEGKEEVLRNWSRIKDAERREKKGRSSVLDGVPASLPALLRAERLGEKASRVGFDWAEAKAVLEKVREEVDELERALESKDAAAIEHEVGDCLFALTSLARKYSISAELALTRTLERFLDRFHHVEAGLRERNRPIHDATLGEMEALWQEAKRR
jgi:MazG family protein